MSHELTTIQHAITLPGCTLYSVGLAIEEGASDEQLSQVGRTLNAIEQCGQWWWGDYLQFILRKHGEKYVDAIAESSYSYQTLRDAKWVCGAFGLSLRKDTLTYSHHKEALSECEGDALKALGWLTKAAENKWSISEMRRAIRTGQATHKRADDAKGQSSVYDYVKEIRLWTRTELPTATPEVRAELKAALVAIVEML